MVRQVVHTYPACSADAGINQTLRNNAALRLVAVHPIRVTKIGGPEECVLAEFAVEGEKEELDLRVRAALGTMDRAWSLSHNFQETYIGTLKEALREALYLIKRARLYKGYGDGPLSEPSAERTERRLEYEVGR